MRIRQISIFLENKPGQLSTICRALADAGVNLETLALADTADFGIVRLIVDDCELAETALKAKGFAVNLCEVLAVCVPDRPGGMAGVMEVLDRAGANVEYSYAFASRKGEQAIVVFRFDDNAKAEAALKAGGIELFCPRS